MGVLWLNRVVDLTQDMYGLRLSPHLSQIQPQVNPHLSTQPPHIMNVDVLLLLGKEDVYF